MVDKSKQSISDYVNGRVKNFEQDFDFLIKEELGSLVVPRSGETIVISIA